MGVYQHRGLNANSPEFHYYSGRDKQAQPVTLYVTDNDDYYRPITMYYDLESFTERPSTESDQSPLKDFSYLVEEEEKKKEHAVLSMSKEDLLHDSSWVRKYEPSRFIDLLSDHLINRNVLTWMKSWDEIVFKKKVKVDSIQSFFKKNSNPSKPWFVEDYNYKKLILLAGPPGCGKTTLARVVAKHCGYHYEEINASDDRSARSLITKIDNLTSNRTVGREQKPVCVIIDEVDGALDSDSNGIKEVLQYLETGVPPGQAKSDKPEKKDKKAEKHEKY
jgi:SpoVK/Ycf46/Vps4 family AAA+-type ATPase